MCDKKPSKEKKNGWYSVTIEVQLMAKSEFAAVQEVTSDFKDGNFDEYEFEVVGCELLNKEPYL